MTKQEEWTARAARWICIALALLGTYLLLRYASGILISLGIAWAVAAIVYPLSVRTARVCHLPQKLCAVAYVLLLLALLGGLLTYGIVRIGEEVEELLARWENGEEGMAGALGRMLEACGDRLSRLPLVGRILNMLRTSSSEHAVGSILSDLLREALSEIGAACSAALGRMLRGTPRVFIGVLVTVMACFYLSADYEMLRTRLLESFSLPIRSKLERLRVRAGKAVRSYLRAYLLLFLLTFSEVLVGLWILRQPYAILIALGVAIVDLLPVFGAGTVLLPWAAIALLFGEYSAGLGLLILYGVITLVRQIAEPHLVGTSLGLHPLCTLLAMFIGWELFGLFGMLIAPAAALLVKELARPSKDEISHSS